MRGVYSEAIRLYTKTGGRWCGGYSRVIALVVAVRALRKPTQVLSLACLFGALSACSVSMPQAEAFVSFLGQTQRVDESSVESRDWLLSAGDTGAVLTLYEGGPHGYVFVGEDGELLSFDGWVVRSFRKSRESPTMYVRDLGSLRSYTSTTRDHAQKAVRCEDWIQRRSEMVTEWRQKCDQIASDNVITLNKTGDVIKIEQDIDHSGSRVTLTRAAL